MNTSDKNTSPRVGNMDESVGQDGVGPSGTGCTFWVTPYAHLTLQVGCPGCSAKENSIGRKHGLHKVIRDLRKLSAEGRLAVWDPCSNRFLSGPDITSVCANGKCIQIGLADDWASDSREENGQRNGGDGI
jgi:hypothetical protein